MFYNESYVESLLSSVCLAFHHKERLVLVVNAKPHIFVRIYFLQYGQERLHTIKKSVRSRGNVNPKNSFPLAELAVFNFLPY
jgi:hypothetical protein